MRNFGEEEDINKKCRMNINNIYIKNSALNKLAHQYSCY